MQRLVVVLVLVVGVSQALSPALDITSGTVKCFLEEVPRDTTIRASFSLRPVGDSAKDVGLRVWFMDPEGNTVAESGKAIVEGSATYTTAVGGEHKVCFITNTSRWFAGAEGIWRATLDVRSGFAATDYQAVAKAENLNALELSVRKANDKVTQIRNEQGYQRMREANFRKTSESTSRRVLWLGALQLTILAGSAFWQVRHLRTFFKKKKFV